MLRFIDIFPEGPAIIQGTSNQGAVVIICFGVFQFLYELNKYKKKQLSTHFIEDAKPSPVTKGDLVWSGIIMVALTSFGVYALLKSLCT